MKYEQERGKKKLVKPLWDHHENRFTYSYIFRDYERQQAKKNTNQSEEMWASRNWEMVLEKKKKTIFNWIFSTAHQHTFIQPDAQEM